MTPPNDADQLELMRRRLADEVRESVEKDLKRKYPLGGGIGTGVMITLVTLLVRVTTLEMTDESRVGMQAAATAQEQAAARIDAASTSVLASERRILNAEGKAVQLFVGTDDGRVLVR